MAVNTDLFRALLLTPVFLFFAGMTLHAGSLNDSLEALLQNKLQDSTRLRILVQLSNSLASPDPAKALEFGKQAEVLAIKTGDQKMLGNVYHSFGQIFSMTGDLDSAQRYNFKAYEIRKKAGYVKGVNMSLNSIGQAYWYKGEIDKALDYYLQAMKGAERNGDSMIIAGTTNNIGLIYQSKKEYKTALDYFIKSLAMKRSIGADKKSIGNTLNNLGTIYNHLGDNVSSERYYLEAIDQFKKANYVQGLSMAYNNISVIYYEKEDFQTALDYNLESLKLKESVGDKRGVTSSYINIGSDYYKMGKTALARDYHMKAYELGKELGILEEQTNALEMLSRDLEKLGDLAGALRYHKKWVELKDSILNTEKTEQMAEMQARYDTEKKDQEIFRQNAELKEKQLDTEKKEAQRNGFIIASVLFLVLAAFVYKGYRQKRKDNQLLAEQKSEIIKQKNIVDEQKREIVDSINYASRIQQSILPSGQQLSLLIPDHFILFVPRDVVSGDFYWCSGKGDKVFVAACDCTGHGVPGAFMSMIGSTLLNGIVNEKGVDHAGRILDLLSEGVINSLKQTGASGESQDGMDISLIVWDKRSNTLDFAGANNPLWLIRGEELREISGNKQPVGIHYGHVEPFASHSIRLEKGDLLYIFTDGYADQFGGPQGKKFKYKTLKEKLLSLRDQPMKKQEEILRKTIHDWRGDLDQVDDMLVMGIRV